MLNFFMGSDSDPPPTRNRFFYTELDANYSFLGVGSDFFPLDRSRLGLNPNWIANPTRTRVQLQNLTLLAYTLSLSINIL